MNGISERGCCLPDKTGLQWAPEREKHSILVFLLPSLAYQIIELWLNYTLELQMHPAN